MYFANDSPIIFKDSPNDNQQNVDESASSLASSPSMSASSIWNDTSNSLLDIHNFKQIFNSKKCDDKLLSSCFKRWVRVNPANTLESVLNKRMVSDDPVVSRYRFRRRFCIPFTDSDEKSSAAEQVYNVANVDTAGSFLRNEYKDLTPRLVLMDQTSVSQPDMSKLTKSGTTDDDKVSAIIIRLTAQVYVCDKIFLIF